jgi:hypothetical protein
MEPVSTRRRDAIGMLKIDFRLSPALVRESMGRGEAEHSDIGADWLSVRPFPRGEPRAVADARLNLLWCEAAFR